MAQGTLGLGRSGCPLLKEAGSLLAHVGSGENEQRTDRSWYSRLVGEEVSWDPLQGQVLWEGSLAQVPSWQLLRKSTQVLCGQQVGF